MFRVSARLFPLVPATALFVSGVPAAAQTLVDALDDPDLTGPITTESVNYFSGAAIPSGLWRGDLADSQVGGDSAASTLPRAAVSRLHAPVQGPAVVTYRWKTAGDDITDSMKFRIEDQRERLSLRGNRNWTTETALVDCGERLLTWEFERLPSVPANSGTARLDALVLTPIPNNPALQGAVENFLFSLHSLDWTSTALDGALNSNAAKSGPVPKGGSSRMVLEVQGPAVVTFDWGVATDPDDTSAMVFLVDDVEQAFLDGNAALQRRTFELQPGWHSLKFVYARSDDGSEYYSGPSEGYVDRLMIDPYGPDADLADAIDRAGGVYSQAWTRVTEVSSDGVDAARATAPEAGTLRRLYVDLPETPGLLTFWARLDTVANQSGYAVRVDGNNVFESTTSTGWRKVEVNLGASGNRLLEAVFARDAEADETTTRAFLDRVSFVPGANNYQADLSVAQKGRSPRGVGVHNLSGARQTVEARAKARRAFGKYVIGLRNGSPSDSDRVSLRGIGSRRHFNVILVVREGGKPLNYSAAFFSGTFRTLSLNPNQTERHEIWVVRRAKSTRRIHHLRALGRSTSAPGKTDAVVTRLKVARR